ncbi:hypothetical protein F0562_017823 [Nyssa sinensis]|uniref:Uncharacterized protein n=1 Tax=Nyssa sinensis TaxID=561372 RepID=A0A5J4ZJV7_9ASTE|nr:hypothetical protein F0562_017823 [Nyssa sinensis]
MALSAAQPSPASLRFESLLRPHRVSIVGRTASVRGLGLGLHPMHHRSSRDRSIFSFAASHEESEPSEIEGGEGEE